MTREISRECGGSSNYEASPKTSEVLSYPNGIEPCPEFIEGLVLSLSKGTRERSWHALDLAVQIGLISAGALGIVALLPRGKEENE